MTSPRQSSRACRCSFATPRSRPASFARCRRRKPCGRCMSVSGDFVGVEERRVPSDVAVAHKDGGHGQCRRQGRAELAGVLFRGGLLIRDDCMGGHGSAWCFGRCRRRASPIAGPSIGGVGGLTQVDPAHLLLVGGHCDEVYRAMRLLDTGARLERDVVATSATSKRTRMSARWQDPQSTLCV